MTRLAPSVVPCTIWSTSARRTRAVSRSAARPRTTPSDGSRGVVSSLPTKTAPVLTSCSTKSVKVPPMSNPRRQEEVTSKPGESQTRGKIEAERSESPENYSTVGHRSGSPRLSATMAARDGHRAHRRARLGQVYRGRAPRLVPRSRGSHPGRLLPEDGQGRLRVTASLERRGRPAISDRPHERGADRTQSRRGRIPP